MAEPKGPLSRDDYVKSAFEIVDERGLASLTMRSLGEHMGVDATAIYRHFPSKERLVDALLDKVIGEAASIQPTGSTARDRIISVALNLRTAFRRHPHLAGAMAQATGNFPNGLNLSRLMIAELRGVGLAGEDLVRMYQTFEGYVLGSSVFDTGGYPETFTIRQARYRYLAEPEFDAVAASPQDVERVTEAAYVDAMNVLLDHCEQLVKR